MSKEFDNYGYYLLLSNREVTKQEGTLMVNTPPEIMTISETAEYLRISLSSLYKLAQDGRIPCQKVGRHWRFRKASIDRWLEQNLQSRKSEKLSEEPTA